MVSDTNIVDFHHEMLAADGLEAQKTALLRAIKPLGYDRFLFGVALGLEYDKVRELLAVEVSKGDWRNYYHANDLHRIDPTVRHCVSHSEPVSFKQWLDQDNKFQLSPEERRFAGLVRDAGYHIGITVPVSLAWSPFRLGMTYSIEPEGLSDALVIQKEAEFERDARYLKLVSNIFATHVDVRRKVIDHFEIRPKTIAIYTELSRGKSRDDIAKTFDLSLPGVKYHIDLLKDKFGVSDWERALAMFCLLGIPDYAQFFDAEFLAT